MHDLRPKALVVNIDQFTHINKNQRTALGTGENLQVTLRSIKVGGEIGLESHPHLDQFIGVERGYGVVQIGDRKDNLYYQQKVDGNYAIIIPAGTWHNITNIGNVPLKLYSIYAPPQPPFGTVHMTKEIAEEMEHETDLKMPERRPDTSGNDFYNKEETH